VGEKMTETQIATVEVPFEALVKELGAKRAIKFLSEIRRKYGDSVVELRRATEKLTIEEIEKDISQLKKEGKI
jgi:DNA-binding transcriptional ArsR family regulator